MAGRQAQRRLQPRVLAAGAAQAGSATQNTLPSPGVLSHADLALHQHHQAAAQRQADAGAFDRAFHVQPLEGLEQPRQLSGVMPAP
jgi:hypothetical protein